MTHGQPVYRIDAPTDTVVLACDGRGAPRMIYWGQALARDADVAACAALSELVVPHGVLDQGEALTILPERGHGFMGRAALECVRDDRRFITQLQLVAAQVAADAITFSLHDARAGVRVQQRVGLHQTGVLTASTTIENCGNDGLNVIRLAPIAMPTSHAVVHAISGRWTDEWRVHTAPLTVGAWVSENRTGRGSHHAPPFVVLSDASVSESEGACIGAHLGWSSDHDIIVERLRDGRVQLQMAQLFAPGEIHLAPGETFTTAPLYAARSCAGFNGLSDKLHPFVRAAILPQRATWRPRPVHINTWEAMYFAQDEARAKTVADRAAQLGAERFVLDDGWFKGRTHDGAALGDWTPDPQRYPHGLAPLAQHVRTLGMEFGLWLEPESINADSDLFRAHPDWVRGEPSRDEPLGRNQQVLDLTRSEVCAHLFSRIDALLRETGAGYVKWDFNRDAAHPASNGRASGVAQTHALYALLDRVRAAHPDVEIEACASGGARADYAILSRCARIWLSDCNDPLDRQRQQRTFSVFFPPEAMGAHVGPAASHTTGRITRMDTRALTAVFGHFGIELDPATFTEKDAAALASFIAFYKQWRAHLHAGRVQRLDHDDPGLIAFCVWTDGVGLLSIAQVDTSRWAMPAPLRLPGLDPQARYRIETLFGVRRPAAAMKSAPDWVHGAPREGPGAMLIEAGLTLPVLRPGDILVWRVLPVLEATSPHARDVHD